MSFVISPGTICIRRDWHKGTFWLGGGRSSSKELPVAPFLEMRQTWDVRMKLTRTNLRATGVDSLEPPATSQQQKVDKRGGEETSRCGPTEGSRPQFETSRMFVEAAPVWTEKLGW